MKRNIFFLALISTLTAACDYTDYKLKVKNSTGSDAYFIIYDYSNLKNYPNNALNLDGDLIRNGTTKKMGLFNQSWKDYVKNSTFGGLNIFVIHEDTVLNYQKDSIVKNEMYSKYFYSLKELESKNWIIQIN